VGVVIGQLWLIEQWSRGVKQKPPSLSLGAGIMVVFLGFLWPRLPIDFDEPDFPRLEITYLMKHYKEARLLNYFNYGGYVIWFSGGELRPFVDARAGSAYPKKIMEITGQLHRDPAHIIKVTEDFQIDVILFPNGSAVEKWLRKSGQWQAEMIGTRATVWSRVPHS
jgi:hypothetical protein